MELNYDISKNLIIWGAGKRGKLLAKKTNRIKY
jgi:hypothetical protein